MADRQLFIDLLARDKTGSATKSAAKNIDDVAVSADEAAKATEKLGKESDKADEKVTRYGKSSRTASEHVEHLDREIKLCERELQKLAVAFAEAETAADRADLSKGIRNTTTELNKLKKNKNVLKDLIPNEDNNPGIFKKFSSSIFNAVDNAKIGPASVSMIAPLAPLIGAVISAGVIGAAGVGGVVGGVLLASKDPRVKEAGTALGQNLLGQLKKDADVFVAPVLANITKIESAFGGMNGDIKKIFSGSSSFLNPLVNGVLGGVKGILGGIASLVSKGRPVIDALGQSFTTIGKAVGSALTTIAGGSKSAAAALNDFANDLAVVIKGIGWAVRGLTELYNAMMLPTRLETNWYFKWKTGIDYTIAKTPVATAAVDALSGVLPGLAHLTLSAGEAAGKAGMQMQTYADAMDEAASKGRGLYDSQIDVAQAVADAEKALKTNGKTLDLNTQKGRDNSKALSDVAGKLVANYDAYVKVNGEGGAAAGIAAHSRAQFIKLAESFGKSAGEAADLATQMGLLPANKKTNFYANTHDAQARIDALKDSIGGVHGKTVTVHVSVTGLEKLDSAGHRIGGYKAAGGPVTAGKAYIVGEKRPEVFVPNVNGTIIPSISKFNGGSGAMASGGGGTAVLAFAPNADSIMATAFLKVLRNNSAFRAEIKKYVNGD